MMITSLVRNTIVPHEICGPHFDEKDLFIEKGSLHLIHQDSLSISVQNNDSLLFRFWFQPPNTAFPCVVQLYVDHSNYSFGSRAYFPKCNSDSGIYHNTSFLDLSSRQHDNQKVPYSFYAGTSHSGKVIIPKINFEIAQISYKNDDTLPLPKNPGSEAKVGLCNCPLSTVVNFGCQCGGK